MNWGPGRASGRVPLRITASGTEGERLLQGTLDCPQCAIRVPVVQGFALFTEAQPGSATKLDQLDQLAPLAHHRVGMVPRLRFPPGVFAVSPVCAGQPREHDGAGPLARTVAALPRVGLFHGSGLAAVHLWSKYVPAAGKLREYKTWTLACWFITLQFVIASFAFTSTSSMGSAFSQLGVLAGVNR